MRLGFSPCPNDTFIFDALVNHRIDGEGFEFEMYIADVEELNKRTLLGVAEVSKVSFHTYLHVYQQYVLLNSGSALGRGCGPLIIGKEDVRGDRLSEKTIAIPGENTTASLLLGFAFPDLKMKEIILFSDIEQAVLDGRTDLGLIIHESRFTYEQKGLKKIADLGEIWEKRTGNPIPLGGIIAKRSLGTAALQKIDRLIRKSLEYSYQYPEEGWPYIKSLAQETDDEVIRQHIGLYVNEFTLDLGTEGKAAVEALFDYAYWAGIIAEKPGDLFLRQ
ncbi:MAG: 1,4-dihydroxy-6-naphthoate synthase [Bacteroidetes bacterium]|nr:1,4-dihydroxy-6-naphthoate synthase [Bacteroidota bacterium]